LLQEADTQITTNLYNNNHTVEPIFLPNLVDDASAKSETTTATNFNPCTVIHEKWNILKEIANIKLPGKWTHVICGNNVIIGIWKLDGSSFKHFILNLNSIVQVSYSFL